VPFSANGGGRPLGVNGLTVADDTEPRRKSDHRAETDEAEHATPRKKRPAAPEVGQALRSVYQQTVDESIPPEMLDLLGKLG